MAKINHAHIAHIVADSPGGPRGDKVRSKLLAKDITNLMLMCHKCHKRIDDPATWRNWPESMLLDFKREHEERISHVTEFAPKHRTHWLFFTARIGDRVPKIHQDAAKEAILESGYYPANSKPLVIDLTSSKITDEDPTFWSHQAANLDRYIGGILDHDLPRSDCQRLALFGVAPIPLLVKLGHGFGQMLETRVFQLHRDDESWSWKTGDGTCTFTTTKTTVGTPSKRVALSISISGQVNDAALADAMPEGFEHYAIRSSELSPIAMKTAGDLARFKVHFLETMARIGGENLGIQELSLFPAVPGAVAVEIGRQKLPKGHPKINIFDFRGGAFNCALTL
jgi:hypothetical protein